MSILSSLKYPVPLGKSEKNQIETSGGEIIQGRWVNKEEDLSQPVKWEKVKSWGSVVDRSLTRIEDSSSYKELAVLTKYENPNNQMPQVELLPVDSELFDTDEAPTSFSMDGLSDAFAPSGNDEPLKKGNHAIEKKNIKQVWNLVWSSFITLNIINSVNKWRGDVQ